MSGRGGEEGAFLILWAILLVALMTMVAIVIDLGDARAVRRDARTIADLAARAAGEELADQDPDPVAACEDAWDYIVTNTHDLAAPPAAMPCNDLADRDPCISTGASATLPETITATNSAPYEIKIRYPVSDDDIEDSRRSGVGVQDGPQCERMQVTVRKTVDTYFARVIGIDTLTAGASATVRGKVELEGTDVPALIILEREACGALQASGQGGILVKGNGVKPGIIAVDSAGSVSPGGCTNNSNPGGKVVYGSPLPAGHPTRAGLPSIEALAADDPDPDTGVPRPPILGVFAMQDNPSRAAYIVPTGVKPAPEFHRRAGRTQVDARYGLAIGTLRTDSFALSSSMPAPSTDPVTNPAPAPYVRLKSILGNSCSVSGAVTVPASHVYIDCNLSVSSGNSITFQGTHFVTSGTLAPGSGGTINFQNPQLVVVKGSTTTNPPAVNIQGTLRVNGGSSIVPCADRNGPSFPKTRFVVLNGRISAGAQSTTQLCQTTLYMAELASPRPDNDNNTSNGYIEVGGQGGVDWSAPDWTDLPACSPFTLPPPDCYEKTHPDYELEDLAMWTEASNLSRIGGAGNIFLTGVFFLPNATFNFDGQAVQNIDRNAQFIVRKLDMSGQGTLILKPDPNDAIPFFVGVYTLIR